MEEMTVAENQMPPVNQFLGEAGHQCRMAFIALAGVKQFYGYLGSPIARRSGPQAIAAMDLAQDQLWFSIQGLLTAAGVIHDIMVNSNAARTALDIKVRSDNKSQVGDPKVLSDANQIRNSILHPEQRLRKWTKGRDNPSIALRNIGPKPYIVDENALDIHINFNPDDLNLTFWDHRLDVQELGIALERIYERLLAQGAEDSI